MKLLYDQPGQKEELVPKWGTTSVTWSLIFKHCSKKKKNDFKLLKLNQLTYMRVPIFFCVRGARFFFFADFEQLHKHTYMRQNPRLYKYPHKHSDLGLKRE